MFLADEHHRGSVNGKAWVNQTLEQTRCRPSGSRTRSTRSTRYRRRFQFHLELKNPPQNVRANITRKHLSGLDVAEFVEKLAARRTLTPAQIHAAARFAQLTHGHVGTTWRRCCSNSSSAATRRSVKDDNERGQFRPLVTTYDLSLLNIETRHPVDKIINALKNKDSGTLCFFGMPGTGKTALGEHIAKSIEKPLIIKKASDLMSKYVGETEAEHGRHVQGGRAGKAGAAAGRGRQLPAEPALAQRSYEVTEVNEMLQGMERFRACSSARPTCSTDRRGGAAPLHVQDPVQAAHP